MRPSPRAGDRAAARFAGSMRFSFLILGLAPHVYSVARFAGCHLYLQLILKLPLSRLDSISLGERIFTRCHPEYSSNPGPPSVQVVFTGLVPAASKSSTNTGAV